jgi:hypothetical protein
VIIFIAATCIGLTVVAGSAYLSWRLEWKSLVIYIALIALSVVSSGSPGDIPMMSIPFVLGGIGGMAFKRGKSTEFYLVTATAILSVLTASFFYYYLLIEKVNFFETQREVISKSFEAAQVPADLRAQWLEVFDASKYVVPFGIVVNALVLSSIAYIFIKNILVRLFGARLAAGIEYFRVHDYFIFVLLSGLAVYLLIDTDEFALVHFAGLNILLIAALFYLVQGLAVVRFVLIKRGIPSYIILLTFAGLLFLGITGLWAVLFLSVLLAGFGALDLWADFRKLSTHDGIKS